MRIYIIKDGFVLVGNVEPQFNKGLAIIDELQFLPAGSKEFISRIG